MRGRVPALRLAARQYHSAPIVAALKPWFEKQFSLIYSGSTFAGDIRYAPGHWNDLTRLRADGRLELDTKPVENAIRPLALTRKNAFIAGHKVCAQNWTLLASLVATCKINEIDPVTYIARKLQVIIDGHPKSDIDELTPQTFPFDLIATA